MHTVMVVVSVVSHVQAIAGMQQRARQLQDALTAGQAHMAPPANYTVFSIPDKDLVVPFVPGPNIARVPDGHAAMAAAEAYVAAGGNGAFNMPFFDIHEKRPFGVLPECALTGNPVVAVLSGLPENSELAQALQVAAQEEVDSEITQVRFACCACWSLTHPYSQQYLAMQCKS